MWVVSKFLYILDTKWFLNQKKSYSEVFFSKVELKILDFDNIIQLSIIQCYIMWESLNFFG